MTSYTRKLHDLHPAAAEAIHRQQFRDYRYGKHVTLANFAAETHALQPFGKRTTPPVLPAYECRAPDLHDINQRQYPKIIVRAASSFDARKEYAAHYNLAVHEIVALRK
jgi:hypothetical protein